MLRYQYLSTLTAEQRKAWNDYYHHYNLCEYSYGTQMQAFFDFCSDNNINLKRNQRHA